MVWSWVRIGVKGWRRGRKEAGTGLSTIFYSKMRSKNLSLYFYFLRKLFGERPLKVAFLYRSGCRIGSFLEILCLLFSSKSSPKIKWLFGLFPKTIIFNKNRYFLGDFSNTVYYTSVTLVHRFIFLSQCTLGRSLSLWISDRRCSVVIIIGPETEKVTWFPRLPTQLWADNDGTKSAHEDLPFPNNF